MRYRRWFDCRRRVVEVPRLRAMTTGVCAATVALAVACLPEQDLASYAAGLPLQANAPAIRVEREDGGAGDSPGLPLSPEAGPGAAEVGGSPLPLAPPPPSRLACRQECECELRDGRDFMLCGTPVTYALAEDRCERAGGALVSIEDAAENTWLSRRMADLANDDYWTSGTDAEDEGVWRWGDGRVFYDETGDAASNLGFAAWDEGQPNDFEGEDCMRAIGGLWRDLDCGEEIAYACER